MTARSTRRTAAMKSRTAAVGAIAVAGALLLTGCGDQTKNGPKSDGTGSGSAPLAHLLPQAVRSQGTIKVGSDIAYAPVEFKDSSGKVAGIDPDLGAALGKELGVTFQFENGTFDTLVTGLRAKRYDIAMSAMTDTKDRQNGVENGKKVGTGVDFVDYYSAGVSIYTRKGKDEGIKNWADLCGKTIVMERGTVSNDLAKAQAKKCPAGKKLTIQAFDDDQQAQTRLRSGGADAGSADSPIAAYAVKTSGGGKDFQIVGPTVQAAPYGIAVAKGNDQLTKALQQALDAIIKNGTYDKILAKWGAEQGAVTAAKVNGGS
ncbi:ABC transporter substrate-binding protein [Streptomyces sp. NPDC090052]|uniref:ABC transporter substrate-binding protein n=1 Tax=unclassified Streptomyces TaxID=2593676 RepID=UPI0022517B6E|nr:ABC transporter substrate-binding protein [Streptomyces sp. NBC_01306]MCX4723815.1 ABC transporter substrate-binding protein [Streptomyces sp. NBC_01306]WSV06609.1 ABC transporter substrate-binding protein [Streptomyces sp. NBC_01020]WSX44729.1 ABC transporter substrate-binding protein [Streptomyces sp. NBC_00963]WSX67258.1 ABC transporter substrate-binding protein [Streptomyces sp. NBC_00932]